MLELAIDQFIYVQCMKPVLTLCHSIILALTPHTHNHWVGVVEWAEVVPRGDNWCYPLAPILPTYRRGKSPTTSAPVTLGTCCPQWSCLARLTIIQFKGGSWEGDNRETLAAGWLLACLLAHED